MKKGKTSVAWLRNFHSDIRRMCGTDNAKAIAGELRRLREMRQAFRSIGCITRTEEFAFAVRALAVCVQGERFES